MNNLLSYNELVELRREIIEQFVTSDVNNRAMQEFFIEELRELDKDLKKALDTDTVIQ